MNKIKVLLVEDETSLAMILSDTLEAQGFEMRTAHDGDDALGVAIHQTDCQNHDNGNGAISYVHFNY